MSQAASSGLSRGVESAFPPPNTMAGCEASAGFWPPAVSTRAVFTGPENIFYLTGQQTPGYYTFQCLIVPSKGEPVLPSAPARNPELPAQHVPGKLRAYGDGTTPAGLVVEALTRSAALHAARRDREGGWFLPISFYEALSAVMPKLEDATGLVEPMRRVKSPAEIAKIEEILPAGGCRDRRGPRRHPAGCHRERHRGRDDARRHQGRGRISGHGAARLVRAAVGAFRRTRPGGGDAWSRAMPSSWRCSGCYDR